MGNTGRAGDFEFFDFAADGGMKISLNWLKEFVEVPVEPSKLGQDVTLVGLAVDTSEKLGDDTIFELDVTTNRPDCLNHLGVAREVSAIYGSELHPPAFEVKEGTRAAGDIFSISIADAELCARYCGRYIEGVRIGPSPEWLKARLEVLGVRSINNVADVTNYVMLELGQPLHAFDADTLRGRQIIVRRANLDEKITTLDGVERALNPSTLVIADAERPIALAGIMGGQDTEISNRTVNVLLESANFSPLSIRKTARSLELSTEASYRFERGADIDMARLACDRAAAMIQTLAGGTVYKDVIDTYPSKRHVHTVGLREWRIAAFLGASVDRAVVERIFTRLGFRITRIHEGWAVDVPNFRVDVSREEDLLEELARHHGFDKFVPTLPKWSGFGAGLPQRSRETLLRDLVAGSGYSEIYSLSLSYEAIERRFRPEVNQEKPSNPLTEDASVLRASLVPGILKAIQWNINHGIRDLQFFELGKVYRRGSEERAMILAATGSVKLKGVHESGREFNFYDLKGDVEGILEAFHLNLPLEKAGMPAYYHPGRSARYGDLAFFGELHPEYAAEPFKIRSRVYLAEFDVDALLDSPERRQVQAIPRFPSIRRDFSLVLDRTTAFGDIKAAIESAGIPELVRVDPFDRMETGPFAESKYSLAISIVYQAPDRTLTDEEVDKFDQHILQLIGQQLGAQLRS
jgi:phenylalanyl-tRNA synthetase beta chain